MIIGSIIIGGSGLLLGLMLAIALAMALRMADVTIPAPQDEALRLESSITKTADFNGTTKDMGSGFAPGGTGLPIAAVINVTAGTRADGDETYTFKLQESSDDSSWTDAGTTVSVTVASTTFTTGVYVAKGFVTKRYVRLLLDVGGTTPSITYEAWLNPIKLAA